MRGGIAPGILRCFLCRFATGVSVYIVGSCRPVRRFKKLFELRPALLDRYRAFKVLMLSSVCSMVHFLIYLIYIFVVLDIHVLVYLYACPAMKRFVL